MRSSISRTESGESSGNPRSESSSREMEGKQSARFVIGITVEKLLKLSMLRVNLTNRNQVKNVRQILAFFETLGIAHHV